MPFAEVPGEVPGSSRKFAEVSKKFMLPHRFSKLRQDAFRGSSRRSSRRSSRKFAEVSKKFMLPHRFSKLRSRTRQQVCPNCAQPWARLTAAGSRDSPELKFVVGAGGRRNAFHLLELITRWSSRSSPRPPSCHSLSTRGKKQEVGHTYGCERLEVGHRHRHRHRHQDVGREVWVAA